MVKFNYRKRESNYCSKHTQVTYFTATFCFWQFFLPDSTRLLISSLFSLLHSALSLPLAILGILTSSIWCLPALTPRLF